MSDTVAMAGSAGVGRMTHARAMALIALLGLPLLLVLLGSGDSNDMMELFNLVPVREAYRDGHWLMPTLNGVPRLEKPPLAAWAPAAFGVMLGTDSLWALRLPAAVMGLVTALAVYGIGCVMSRDRRLGLVAAVVTLTSIVFLRHARLASYDIFSTGFLTLGMLGLFGMVEAARSHRGRAAWAMLAGAGIGLSILSKGPVPVATVCVPFGGWLLMYHRGRKDVWIFLTLAAAVSLVFFVPWLIAVGAAYSQYDPWGVWYREILQNSTAASNNSAQTAADLKRPIYYYVQMLGWVAPHVPLAIAGLALPFLKRPKDEPADASPDALEKRGRMAFWLVLVGGLVILSLLAEKKPRYAMPLFPFAGLLAACVCQEFWRAAGRKLDVGGALVYVAQALVYLVTGGLMLAVGLVQAAGGVERLAKAFNPGGAMRAVADLANAAYWPFVLLAGGALMLLGREMVRRFWRRDYGGIDLGSVFGAALMVFCLTYAYRRQPENCANPIRPHAEEVTRAIADAPLLTLRESRPWLSTLYFVNRIIPEDTAELALAGEAVAGARDHAAYYLVPDRKASEAVVAKMRQRFDVAEVYTYVDEQRRTNRLYRVSRRP